VLFFRAPLVQRDCPLIVEDEQTTARGRPGRDRHKVCGQRQAFRACIGFKVLDEVVMGVKRLLALLPKIEFQRTSNLVEEDLRKEIEAFNLKVHQDRQSDTLFMKSHLAAGNRVLTWQESLLKRFCILEQLPAGVFVPFENYIQKCRIPRDLRKRHCELVVVFIRKAFSLQSYEPLNLVILFARLFRY
jgi:hypothetical protein